MQIAWIALFALLGRMVVASLVPLAGAMPWLSLDAGGICSVSGNMLGGGAGPQSAPANGGVAVGHCPLCIVASGDPPIGAFVAPGFFLRVPGARQVLVAAAQPVRRYLPTSRWPRAPPRHA